MGHREAGRQLLEFRDLEVDHQFDSSDSLYNALADVHEFPESAQLFHADVLITEEAETMKALDSAFERTDEAAARSCGWTVERKGGR
jgi:hypothetical protein